MKENQYEEKQGQGKPVNSIIGEVSSSDDDLSLDSVNTRRAEAEIEKGLISIKKSKVTDEGMRFPLLKEILGKART